MPEATRYHSVYCHFDGDLVGQVLREHYPSEQDARTVINHGDLSSIEPDRLNAYQDRGGKLAKSKAPMQS